MRRTIGIAAVGALAASGLALVAPAQAIAPHSAAQAAALVKTTFGMEAHAFGTKIDRNRFVNSGATANSVISCTTLAGLTRQNAVLDVNTGPLLIANEVRSRNTTRKDGGTVTVTSRNTITNGSLLGGDVRFRGLSSQSKTWHDANGFHNKVSFDLAKLVIDGNEIPLTGEEQIFNVNTVGQLTVFERHTKKGPEQASARGVVLKLVLLGGPRDGTRIRVGSSHTRMYAGVHGPMSGSTWASQVNLGDGKVVSGKTAFQVMPCQGTDGEVRYNPSADVTLPNILNADGLATHVMGVQGRLVQHGYTQAEVANAVLGASATPTLTITGIESKANVRRDGDGLTRNAKGTHLIDIQLAGQSVKDQLIAGESVDIGGFGVTFKKVNMVKNGIEVVALEVKLLNNTTIELGHSIMKIKKN
jgi:hypothetical protein